MEAAEAITRGTMIPEPKKYTAKEAMHWMLDHPGEVMWCLTSYGVETLYRFDSGDGRFEFQGIIDKWKGTNGSYFGGGRPLYVRTEYDAWQAALKAEAEKAKDSEPREGESLADYAQRLTLWCCNKEIRGEVDAWQRWIESYVRREIKKAMEEK